ncbi:hypothetical protein GCM10010387_62660 [Streptomyces inusitatus]|uniref:Uncharacterized protein n=1 Tax=Streptomyces inusitatus TaxID=68221 RepID=A0A918QN44_9ACTN|nr:hypothetical protein [Streptomyces inusitatus]GGZ60417.1 hypothetical protein GCM10010387_62660 [Streptomyces inusitatus]
MPPPNAAGPRLLVADHVAGSIRVLSLPDGRETGRIEGRFLAEHAGFLALPGGRTAFVDDLAGELLVLDPYGPDGGGPLVTATAPVATPAEHLAADPSGRLLAVTTGLGRNEEAWSDLLTVVDLDHPHRPRTARVRTRAGEPGVTLPGPAGAGEDGALVVLRHREPGSLTAYRHADLLAAAPSAPPAAPVHELPLPDHDGHGDAHDPSTGLTFAAAGSGVHRVRRAGSSLLAEEPLPWGGPGRGYFLRLDPVRRILWSCVRGGPADPGRWPEWTNDAWWHRLDPAADPAPARTGRVPLGPGLVFRLAVTARHVAFARVHPDGDELVLVSAPPGSAPRVSGRLPLPAMDGAPRAGGTPWDGVQRRAIAGSPGGGLVAVTRGGHGEIQLVDASRAETVTTLRTPTPLDEGGHLALVFPGDGAEFDPVGR